MSQVSELLNPLLAGRDRLERKRFGWSLDRRQIPRPEDRVPVINRWLDDTLGPVSSKR